MINFDREYPNKPGVVLTGPDDLKTPRELHPAFYGHYDWHSSVHAHWMLVRLLRLYPELPDAAAIRARLAGHLTPANLQVEAEYFAIPENRSFERMYGWAWALRLAQELRAWDDPDARRWAATLAPLEAEAAARLAAWLPKLRYAIRAGEHSQTAFAFGLAWDWSLASGDAALRTLLADKARQFYQGDRGCPLAYEPSGEDFLPPCLAEADFMRRVLPPREFAAWLTTFLPAIPRHLKADSRHRRASRSRGARQEPLRRGRTRTEPDRSGARGLVDPGRLPARGTERPPHGPPALLNDRDSRRWRAAARQPFPSACARASGRNCRNRAATGSPAALNVALLVVP